MKSKVLMLATTAAMIEQFNKNNILILEEMGYEVHVAGNFKEGNPVSDERLEQFKEWLSQHNGKWFHIPSTRKPTDINNIRAYRQVVGLTKKYKYEFIHCHTPIGSVIARSAAHKTNTPIIYTAHGFHFYKGAPLKNWLVFYPVEKFFSRWTDVLVLINQEDYKRAERKFKAKKTYYVPGVGIDLNRYKKCTENDDIRDEFNIPSKAKVILSVGEVNRNKNHKLGITSISKLNDDSIYYIICGQGKLIEENRKLAKALGVDNRVIFAGYRSDVERFYNTADIFLFPSLREGLSVSMMEAMAMGVPIICNSIRGNTDLIDDGINGVLINNTVEEAVKAIKLLLNNSSLRESISMAEREKIEQFGLDNVMDKMRNIYTESENSSSQISHK